MIIQTIYQCALLLFVYMSCCFVIARIKKDDSIVDIAWGIGFLLITWFTFFKTNQYLFRHLLVSLLVTLWALRLSGYLFIRNWGKKEDVRYPHMKEQWGQRALLYSFLFIFMLQGVLILVISYPIILVNCSLTPGLNAVDICGAVFWIIGFLFESISDWQLYRFLQNPDNIGKVMTKGLWNYSRHPNYFGETIIWWGIWLISLSVPYGITAIISPLTITILLLYISGVPLAEKQVEQLEGFQAYKKRTNYFIPWFAKNRK